MIITVHLYVPGLERKHLAEKSHLGLQRLSSSSLIQCMIEPQHNKTNK